MSDEKAVRYLLANNGPLVAVVPATRIMAGVIPQNSALPAISVARISRNDTEFIAGMSVHDCQSRVQITVMAATRPALEAALALVRTALPRTYGSVNGVAVKSLTRAGTGPVFQDEETKVCMGSLDYAIRFDE